MIADQTSRHTCHNFIAWIPGVLIANVGLNAIG